MGGPQRALNDALAEVGAASTRIHRQMVPPRGLPNLFEGFFRGIGIPIPKELRPPNPDWR